MPVSYASPRQKKFNKISLERFPLVWVIKYRVWEGGKENISS